MTKDWQSKVLSVAFFLQMFKSGILETFRYVVYVGCIRVFFLFGKYHRIFDFSSGKVRLHCISEILAQYELPTHKNEIENFSQGASFSMAFYLKENCFLYIVRPRNEFSSLPSIEFFL